MTKYDFHGTSSNSSEHYTPVEWLDSIKLVMGDIDVDPASCDTAQEHVKANRYFTKDDDGLAHEWFGRVYINPPGDKTGKIVRLFWSKLVLEVIRGHVSEFMWLAFNISQLRTLQHSEKPFLYNDSSAQNVLESSFVSTPYSRIHFTGAHPTRDSAFIYFGHKGSEFRNEFRKYGIVHSPSRSFQEVLNGEVC